METAFVDFINVDGVIVSVDSPLLDTEWTEGTMGLPSVSWASKVLFICVISVNMLVIGAGTHKRHRCNWVRLFVIGRSCSR